jgi:hypothetical protein
MNDFLELISFFHASNSTFSLTLYIILSFIYIMIYHFALNLGSEFNLLSTVSIFVFAGILGAFTLGFEGAFVLAMILSLIFIGGPRKDL